MNNIPMKVPHIGVFLMYMYHHCHNLKCTFSDGTVLSADINLKKLTTVVFFISLNMFIKYM